MESGGTVGLHSRRIVYFIKRGIPLTTLHTLASGSSGNAALISRNGTHLLVDAGISCRRITNFLQQLGLTPHDLSGIFITHSHTDHVSGLNTILKHWDVPIYATRDTGRQLSCKITGIENRLVEILPGVSLSAGDITVSPFATAHDAPGSCGYRFDDTGFLTDTGYITEAAADILSGTHLLILESNHDVETLLSGPYPYFLKERILGRYGHLSNEAAAEFARICAENGTREIVLAHLSKENNTPTMAYNVVARALAVLDTPPTLSVAPRDELSRCYQTEGSTCRK